MLFIPLPGMTLPVGLFQVADGEPGVMAQGFQGFMTQQVLDVVDVGAAADEFSSAAPAECMGRDVDFYARIAGMAVYGLHKALIRHAGAPARQKKRQLGRIYLWAGIA